MSWQNFHDGRRLQNVRDPCWSVVNLEIASFQRSINICNIFHLGSVFIRVTFGDDFGEKLSSDWPQYDLKIITHAVKVISDNLTFLANSIDVSISQKLSKRENFISIFIVLLWNLACIRQLTAKIKIGQIQSALAGGDPCRALLSKLLLVYALTLF